MSMKEAHLITEICLFAARCYVEGDHTSLRLLGFSRDDIEALLEMTLADLLRLTRPTFTVQPLNVTLDRPTFAAVVHHLKQERENEKTMFALIRANAPLEMMKTFYGMHPAEYSGRREILQVPNAPGRPPAPDEETTHKVWRAWSELLAGRDPMEVRAEEYLKLHEETGVPLRQIWPLTRSWAVYGAPPNAATGEHASDKTNVLPVRQTGASKESPDSAREQA